jgi:uncharacterized membrane protein YbhN (UPF0104 family)
MKYLKLSLKILVSIGLVTYLIITFDFSKSWNVILNSNQFFFLLSFSFIILNYLFSAIRWKYLIISDKKISIWYLIKLYFIGSFFNNFLPTSIGGDAYKILKLGEKIDSKTDAFTATFLERFLGMIALMMFSLYGLLSYSGSDERTLIVGLFLVVLAFIIFLIFYPRFKFEHRYLNKLFSVLDKIHNSFVRYKKFPHLILISLISSIVVQLFSVMSQFVLFLAIGYSLPLDYSFFAFPIIFLSGYAIPSLNGIGSQDFLYQKFFSSMGIVDESIIAASVLYHLSRFLVSLIGGILYALEKK